ncbi:MAG: hypothetical protein INH41_13845 [Myxococcaceae bacterium]|jgi:hypothetical protein|nr:hypothetical protein [Myxococcaceae bacterium]
MLSMCLVAALAATPTVSVQFDGPLKQGLTTIAQQGGLNVIVVGALDEPAQIHLTDASPSDALEAVARAYGLEVTRQGSLYVLRRANEAPRAPTPGGAPAEGTSPGSAGEPAAPTAPTPAGPAQAGGEADGAGPDDDERPAPGEAREARAHGAERISAGGPVVVRSGETVKHAVAYGGPVVVEPGARVVGDAVAFGGDVVLKDASEVGGDAVSFGGRVVREGAATVKGEEVSFGGAGLASTMAAHAVKANQAVAPADDDEGSGLSLASFLVQFVVFFVFGFVLMVLAPQRMKGLEAAVREQPVVSGVVGFLALLLAVPLTLFLLVTVIGIPVAAVLWLVLALVVPMGLAAIANALGTSLPLGSLRRTQAMVLALGVLALLVVTQVPVLGPLAMSLAVCVSLGAVLRTRLGTTPKGLPVPERLQHLEAR